MKNFHSSYFIDKEFKKFLENKFTTKKNTNIVHNNKWVSYFKLTYIGSYSNSIKKKIMSYVKSFAKKFSPFKLQNLFSSKDCFTVTLKSFVVYKFTCAGCQSCCIEKTKRCLPTWIKEILQTDTTPEWESCELFHNNWSHLIFLQIKTEGGALHHLVKASTKQTEESRKFHNLYIMQDISFHSILGFLLSLFF